MFRLVKRYKLGKFYTSVKLPVFSKDTRSNFCRNQEVYVIIEQSYDKIKDRGFYKTK